MTLQKKKTDIRALRRSQHGLCECVGVRGVGEVLSIVFRVHNAGKRSVTNRGSEGFAKGFRDGEGSRACGGRSGRTVGKAREDPREGGGNDGGKDVRHLPQTASLPFCFYRH